MDSAMYQVGLIFVKIENIYNNHIKTSSITQFITKETHDYLKRSQLHADDVLFSIAGTIGQVAIVHRDDLPANTNQAISIIRDPLKLLNTKYLSVILQSKPLNILSKARGVGIYNVSLEDIKNTKIPLPPLAEQKRIIAKIESIFTQIDVIEEHVEFTLVLIDRLKNSTLKSAFEGRLVPQDPDDEPVEILLQKIRQEKEQISPKAKSIRRKQKTCQMKLPVIVQKLWNFCNVLRDDGVSYGDYVQQITNLLFLKMADEQNKTTV